MIAASRLAASPLRRRIPGRISLCSHAVAVHGLAVAVRNVGRGRLIYSMLVPF
jgi:hypothetical protein